MFEASAPVRFFLGANTPVGFVSYAEDLYDTRGGWRAYIIKGGPGTGKGSMMRAVLQAMTDRGLPVEAVHCSSDPASLDAVIVPGLKACIVDGTAPHIIEPKYWGAVERIVNLGDCIDNERLVRQAPEILEATDACSALHARCRKFIGAAASLLGDSARIAQDCTDAAKAARTAERVADKEFPAGRGVRGKEKRRFLSAVTPEGLLVFHETLQALCPQIYAIEDETGAASRILLAQLRARALEAGLDIVSCACPLSPHEKLEHLVIPSLGLAFTTSNTWHKADFPVYRRIHAARFTDAARLRQKRPILSFNRRAARELLGEAVSIAQEAKQVHDVMEAFNVRSMNWEKADALTHRVVAEFLLLAEAAGSSARAD